MPPQHCRWTEHASQADRPTARAWRGEQLAIGGEWCGELHAVGVANRAAVIDRNPLPAGLAVTFQLPAGSCLIEHVTKLGRGLLVLEFLYSTSGSRAGSTAAARSLFEQGPNCTFRRRCGGTNHRVAEWSRWEYCLRMHDYRCSVELKAEDGNAGAPASSGWRSTTNSNRVAATVGANITSSSYGDMACRPSS